jgi:Phosphopantothenoylcysteine decarboxylase (EC 4.1.1.36)
MIVANEAVASIGAGDIQMILIDAQGVERLPQLPKPVAAERLLDAIIERFAARLRAPEIGSMTTEE